MEVAFPYNQTTTHRLICPYLLGLEVSHLSLCRCCQCIICVVSLLYKIPMVSSGSNSTRCIFSINNLLLIDFQCGRRNMLDTPQGASDVSGAHFCGQSCDSSKPICCDQKIQNYWPLEAHLSRLGSSNTWCLVYSLVHSRATSFSVYFAWGSNLGCSADDE